MIWKVPPRGSAWVSVTNHLGRRRYLSLETPVASIASDAHVMLPDPKVPIDQLLERIEMRKRLALMKEADARRAQQQQSSQALSSSAVSDDLLPLVGANKQLWVDKYRPKTFLELLSPETLNRRLLQWLKKWDHLVFGTSSARKPASLRAEPPEPKIALLHGPPGLGKTTLAHFLAKMAGYRPVEINASDDRSGDGFMQKVLNAVETETAAALTTETPLPNCLIIDELDGSTADDSGAVEAILKVVNFTANKKSKASSSKKKKAPEPSRTLARPIICICNNPYVPALRELRQQAELFAFDKPNLPLLLNRLRSICQLERLHADQHVLSLLVERSQGDIRSCLNTLQYVKAKSSLFSIDELATSAVGHKDISKGYFEVLQSVFCTAHRKRQTSSEILWRIHQQEQETERRRTAQDASSSADLHVAYNKSTIEAQKAILKQSDEPDVLDLITSFPDIDTLVAGAHENFLNTFYSDPTFQITSDCYDALSTIDLIQHLRDTDQAYELYRYLPFAVQTFHLNCATASSPVLAFPQTTAKANGSFRVNRNVAQTFLQGCPPESCLRGANPFVLASEIAPFINSILTPRFQHGNPKFLEKSEREILEHTVELYRNYGIRFIKGSEEAYGAPVLYPDPPLAQLITYPDSPQPTLSILQMQTIQTLLDRPKIITTTSSVSSSSSSSSSTATATVPTVAPQPAPKPILKIEIQKDFFGREVILPSSQQQNNTNNPINTPNSSHTSFVTFKFHEGATNAVRRTITVKSLR